MFNDRHAHVMVLCRSHFPSEVPNIVYIGETLQEAREYMSQVPTQLDDTRLGGIEFRQLDPDVVRVRLAQKGHDLISFTVECSEDYEECLMNFKRTRAIQELESRIQKALLETMPPEMREMLETAMGASFPTPESPAPEEKPIDNQAFAKLMNQIDLPEDFFGKGH